MEDIERQAIFSALQKPGSVKSEAAKALGIGLKTLYRKLEKYQEEGHDLGFLKSSGEGEYEKYCCVVRGREHALAWKGPEPYCEKLFSPLETLVRDHLERGSISVDDIVAFKYFAKKEEIDLTIVGPEAPWWPVWWTL